MNENINDDLIILSVICRGVHLATTSPLLNSGFLSRMTGGSIPRNVKKIIRLQKSEPFIPGGRPTSMLYDTVYESEPFEDVATLSPSLVAEFRNPSDKDCKLRVNVYYNSSLTNGKEILLVATTFNLREFLRCKTPIFTSQMVSEHCNQAVAYIRRLYPLTTILQNKSIQSTSPIISKWNPMFQRYIFHSDHEQNQPVVAEEYTWEPRLTYNVSYKYLLNLSNILTETLTAWKVRLELERMRQGKFLSREEAFLNGWYEISILISSCLLNAVAVSPTSSSIDYEENSPTSPSLSVSGEEKNSFLNKVRNDEALGPPIDNRMSTNGQKRKPAASGPKQPSCFVEVSIEYSELPFAIPIGRTNTEYFTLSPSFGSNLNPRVFHYLVSSNICQAGMRNTSEYQLSPLADPDNVNITKIPFEHVVEDIIIGPESRTVKYGTKSCFHVFVPFSTGGRIRCDLFLEDISSNGKGILVGTSYYPLQNLQVKSDDRPTNLPEFKIPVSIKNATADPKWQILDADIHLGVSLQQQSFPSERSETFPPVSPHMNRFFYGDYNEKSLGFTSFSKSLKIFQEADITENLDLLVEKMSLDRFSDSDDDEEEDDDDEFSSPTLKPSTKKQDIVPSTFPSPSKIPKSEENTTSSRLPPSVATTNNVPRDLRKASFYSAEILGECYEWMWHVGFKGIDPLSLPSTNDSKKSQNSTTPTPTTTTGEYFPRVDIPYSLIWINEHIKRLEYILCQIKYLLATFYEEITLNKSFRASKFKKEMEYQAVPINLHIQNLVLQKCSSEMNSMKKSDDPTAVHIVDSVTCGAMACHGLGYSQGGLHNIETGLQRTKANLENFKKQYMNDTSTIQMNKLSKSGEEITFNSKSREYEFREFLATSLFNYENSTTNIILRRIYSLSQIISIALNSFLYKLELVIEGHIPSYFFERWYSFGFLILFECLLSVNGKERAMLEDTRTAIDMIQLYHIRVLPSPNPLINNPNSSHEWYRDQNINEQKRFQWLEGIRGDCADTHIIGREILLFIPENSITSLPEPIRSIIMTTGAIFNIKAALFSQGIDIMQSMTNAWDSHESGLSSRDLQYQINLQGLQQLNTYCELVQPVRTTLSLSTSPSSCPSNSVKLVDSLSSSPPLSQPTPTTGHLYSGLTQEAHPLIEVLSNIIYTTNINEKNVEMLIEVERIGRILGACRVTFCKSGKDRTGMAITLEQSRLLGENFDCGQSFERIIRDANTMRQYGTRLMVAEKNIGRAIYAINRLQIKFLPLYYRPPIQLTEDIIKKSDNS